MEFPELRSSSVKSLPWQPYNPVLMVPVRFNHMPSYQEFFSSIFIHNQLCVLGPDATGEWISRKFWVKEDGSPNFGYIEEHFGEVTAPVADCSGEEFCTHPKTEMKVKDYLEYWQRRKMEGHSKDSKCLYLKDWHFTRNFPSYCAYTTPDLLCSDWMNEFWDVRRDDKTDDYRFVYMGPKHSWTPFHADVLRSYSWSANICGQKKWIFYPPGDESCLKDKFGQLVFDLQSEDLKDSERYPQATAAEDKAITVIQNPGEIIFVPSGWHHQVINMEDTISINHNWMNGCSAHLSWQFLKSQLAAVQREIDDCKDMDGWHTQCQMILKADSGMDYIDFYNFMSTIASHRLTALQVYMDLLSVEKELKQERTSAGTENSLRSYSNSGDPTALNDKKNVGHQRMDLQVCVSDSEDKFCCLCLYRKEVLTSMNRPYDCARQTTSSQSSRKRADSEKSCDKDSELQGIQSQEHHQSCPHWSHCGPNLALFDLHRVLDIVKDMQEQEEFIAVIEDEASCSRLLGTLPSALIDEIKYFILGASW